MSPSFGSASVDVLMTSRSAYFGVSVAVALLFARSGSGSATAVISTTFVCGDGIVPGVDGASTFAVITRSCDVFGSISGTAQTPVPESYVPTTFECD